MTTVIANNIVTFSPPASTTLAEHVTAIHALGKQTIANVIEIGNRLTECKRIVGHRNFGNWLDREFGWSERTAQNFMRVFELSKIKPANFADLDLPVSAIYLLAAPSTPKKASDEVIKRAEAGENVPFAEVKQTIEDAKELAPAPKGRKRPSRKAKPSPSPQSRQNATVSKKLATYKRRIADLEAERKRLQQSVRKAELERASLCRKIDDLTTLNKALETENAKLKTENDKLKDENSKLKSVAKSATEIAVKVTGGTVKEVASKEAASVSNKFVHQQWNHVVGKGEADDGLPDLPDILRRDKGGTAS